MPHITVQVFTLYHSNHIHVVLLLHFFLSLMMFDPCSEHVRIYTAHTHCTQPPLFLYYPDRTVVADFPGPARATRRRRRQGRPTSTTSSSQWRMPGTTETTSSASSPEKYKKVTVLRRPRYYVSIAMYHYIHLAIRGGVLAPTLFL